MSGGVGFLRWGLAALSLSTLPWVGCGSEPMAADETRVESRRQLIRPTDGNGWNGNGYGIPAKFYDPPGGHFRVYYVESGDNAVDPKDEAPKNGVPDFVELVGASAEATYASTIGQRGFRAPLDDSIYHDRPDYGGDGRFDIYLRLSGAGSDGYRVTEVCTDGTPTTGGGAPGRCAGYFVMNPGFKGSHYPSERDGVEVLTSHELFHSVQDAYNAGQWRTWTEGTAVWNELQVFPGSAGTWKDYLGFVPGFFREPERPLDQSMGAGAAAAYAYGAAVWVEYLSERFGPAIIREIWERLEQPIGGSAPHFLDATEAALALRGSNLKQAWVEFTGWNLLTRERATGGQGYNRASEYPSIRFESELSQADSVTVKEFYGLSARYFRLPVQAATTIYVSRVDPLGDDASALWGLLVDSKGVPRSALQVLSPNQGIALAAGDALLVVLTARERGAKARRIELKTSTTAPALPPTDPPANDPSAAMGGCVLASRSSQRPPWPGMLGLALCVAGLSMRTRRRRA